MIFCDKMQLLRKNCALTQEDIAEKLGISRQSVAKWESGQCLPDIPNLIALSDIFHVTTDYLLKDSECEAAPIIGKTSDIDRIIDFRLEANRHTYAAFENHCESTRGDSVDFHYERGGYAYHDTYVGGEQFAGQEAVWKDGKAVYAMNYCGRVLDERFSGNFLKEALRAAEHDFPFRGPKEYRAGSYLYTAEVNGDISWFQGFEEIYCEGEKVYECCFHGGLMK